MTDAQNTTPEAASPIEQDAVTDPTIFGMLQITRGPEGENTPRRASWSEGRHIRLEKNGTYTSVCPTRGIEKNWTPTAQDFTAGDWGLYKAPEPEQDEEPETAGNEVPKSAVNEGTSLGGGEGEAGLGTDTPGEGERLTDATDAVGEGTDAANVDADTDTPVSNAGISADV